MSQSKKCQYCGAELTIDPNHPQKKYCNAVHRVYANRRAKADAKKKVRESPAKPEKPPVLAKIDPQPTAKPKTLDDLKKMIPANVLGVERQIRLAELKEQYGIK